MQDSIFRVTCDDQFSLRAISWGDSLKSPKGLVVVVHGMAEYGARYDAFANALVQKGYRVWAADHRGHGLNITGTTPKGHIADKDSVGRAAKDQHALIGKAFETGLPVVVLGHSFGTSVVRKYLVDYRDAASRLAGVVLSSTAPRLGFVNFAMSRVAWLQALLQGPEHPSALMSSLVFSGYEAPFEHRTKWDWLSRDPAIVDAYIADRLCGFDCSAAFWRDHLGTLPGLEKAESKGHIPGGVPMLLLAGTQDALSVSGLANGALGEAYTRSGSVVEDYRVPLGRHETLSDPRVSTYVVGWVETVTKSV